MPTRKCVGVVLYNNGGKIFFMSSPKWKAWIVPGGGIEGGETAEQTLRREVKEELGIEITDIVYIGEKIKPPSKDFKDPTMTFHFFEFSAKACSTKITPNEEISEYDWFTEEEALKLNLMKETRGLLEKYIEYKSKNLTSKSKP